METYDEVFSDYLISERRLSENTLKSYMQDLDKFFDYLAASGIKDVKKTNKTVILTYLLSLQTEGKKIATISRRLASIRSYFSFLDRAGIIKNDPTNGIDAPKSEKKPPSVLTQEEINLFLSQPDNKDLKGIRDKAMLELLYATGIKVSELVSLNISDINLEMGFLHCKKGRERIIPLGKIALEAMKDYMHKARKSMIKDDSEQAVFVNVNGRRITRQGFWKIVKRYKETANIKTDIAPHTIRHSFAAHLLENGADLESISEMLGYSDISSTQIYSKLIKSKIRDVYQKAHPRA